MKLTEHQKMVLFDVASELVRVLRKKDEELAELGYVSRYSFDDLNNIITDIVHSQKHDVESINSDKNSDNNVNTFDKDIYSLEKIFFEMFSEKNLSFANDNFVLKSELYECYAKFCGVNNHSKPSFTSFCRWLKDNYNLKDVKIDDRMYWAGLKIIENNFNLESKDIEKLKERVSDYEQLEKDHQELLSSYSKLIDRINKEQKSIEVSSEDSDVSGEPKSDIFDIQKGILFANDVIKKYDDKQLISYYNEFYGKRKINKSELSQDNPLLFYELQERNLLAKVLSTIGNNALSRDVIRKILIYALEHQDSSYEDISRELTSNGISVSSASIVKYLKCYNKRESYCFMDTVLIDEIMNEYGKFDECRHSRFNYKVDNKLGRPLSYDYVKNILVYALEHSDQTYLEMSNNLKDMGYNVSFVCIGNYIEYYNKRKCYCNMNNELIGELMTKYGKFEKISDSYSNNSSNTVNDESEEEEENRDDYEEDADDITEIITIEDQIRGSEDGYRDHYGIKGGEYHKY